MSSEIRTVVVSKPLHRPRGCEEGEELPWNEEGGGGGGHDEYYDGPELNLMMICCEENEPYGPALDTATMFLELLCASYERYRHHREDDDDNIDDDNDASSNYSEQRPKGVVEEDEDEDEDGAGAGGDAKPLLLRRIRITVYHAQRMDYPQSDAEWDGYDGIIIPGSLSAAYDAHVGWIRRLLNVIRTEIHDKRRKTMGVCFGHQCFAHSFRYPPPLPLCGRRRRLFRSSSWRRHGRNEGRERRIHRPRRWRKRKRKRRRRTRDRMLHRSRGGEESVPPYGRGGVTPRWWWWWWCSRGGGNGNNVPW